MCIRDRLRLPGLPLTGAGAHRHGDRRLGRCHYHAQDLHPYRPLGCPTIPDRHDSILCREGSRKAQERKSLANLLAFWCAFGVSKRSRAALSLRGIRHLENPQPLETNEKPRNRCGSEVFHLAAGEGFEPSHTESESAVLPLHKPARSVGRSDQPQRTDIIIQNIAFLSIGFFKVFHFFRRGE